MLHTKDLELFNNLFFEKSFRSNNVNYDIIEDDDQFIIDLELAGFDKNDFDIKIDDDNLIITGERKIDTEKIKYNYRSTSLGKFKKSFYLPKDVLVEKIDAKYTDGILSIIIPKDKEKIKNKSIVIR